MMTPATGEKRRARILEYLCERESASVDELAQQFAVSRMTVHRDLDQLAAARCVRKTHGGATILSSVVFESNFNYRARRHQEDLFARGQELRRVEAVEEPASRYAGRDCIPARTSPLSRSAPGRH